MHSSVLIYFLSLYCFVFLSPFVSSAQVSTNEQEEVDEAAVEDSIEFSASSNTADFITFDIFEDIARARALLEGERCGFQVTKVVKVAKGKKGKNGKKGKRRQVAKKELGEFSILLAVENVKTREIQVARVHPKLGGRSGSIILEPGRSNGVNTKFTIISPEHHIVLALKRPVRNGTTFKEVVYTPYSEGLDIPAVRDAGLDYLKNTLSQAKQDLLGRQVRPLSCDTFAADDVALTLAIIEHIDPQKFESGKYTAEQLIHETLVIMGANKGSAYRYSASRAGARGLFQFIPDTYKRIVRLYPRAGLHQDFVRGMEDHENAAKASFLLFDADMQVLNNDRREQIMGEQYKQGRFLASAYNCGSGRTRGAMDGFGENWHFRVPGETQIYLKKYDVVWKWLRARL